MSDDDYTWLDKLQDLGAWIFVMGLPALGLAISGRLLGWW